MVVESRSYMQKLVEQANLHFIVTGKVKETGQIVTTMKVVTLHNPQLTVTVWNSIYFFYPILHCQCLFVRINYKQQQQLQNLISSSFTDLKHAWKNHEIRTYSHYFGLF